MNIKVISKKDSIIVSLVRDKKQTEIHPKPFSEQEVAELYQAHVFLQRMFQEVDEQEGGEV